ncbi:beta-N-acetylglucosaminidase domain-containing protein [Streptomyces beijiangensis]|uniref:Beta-N-acetylglucosaminidase domain-containing protein n=1 Tax=Streptomyces beijiangensis TaxID=163361 RepID=A0A939F4V5_9ACTN|nr:beta-N-acetylglucosaminidase domain-containing protein [Streptomyces beijiangensis]MBO0511514.1 beta-N-acetylglucosaminidase domain-containing protein [Streptomyces beijiangensis]
MQLGRRRRATAVAVAVLGSLLGAAPGSVAAPNDPGTGPGHGPGKGTATANDRSDSPLPPVWPRPQSMRAAGQPVPLGTEVTLDAAPDADPYAVDALRDVLAQAGVRTVSTGLPGRGPVIRLGGAGAQDALRDLRAPALSDLPSGGYRIATGQLAGRDTVALDGVGEDGLFHAVQTLRQLISHGTIPGVAVRDWPGTAVRGTTEGFYGQPWTREQRLDQIDFMGRTKQNRYLYAAGDDPYRQAGWRDPYPAAQRADFRALAERAARNHVTLGWAVAPAQAMCMSSDKDMKALNRKIDAMWALGVRSFQLQFQDVSYSEWHCSADSDAFGSGPEAAAKAQARVAGTVAAHLAAYHPGADPLSLMPTEYFQDGATAYRRALADRLDPRVQVAWTGVGVVPKTITGSELAGARAAFKHPLVTMDNYPVNDYAPGRIFLGPYTGREPAVASGSSALLANAMQQPSASRIPLFTAADYAWNPKAYSPQESWQAAVDDLAGSSAKTREALTALSGNDASSVLGGDESAYLKPLIAAFWAARATTDRAAQDKSADSLRAAFTVMREAPQRLKDTAGGALENEVGPWIDQLARYGRAGELAVDILRAQTRGDGTAAWQAQLALEPVRRSLLASKVTVGKGVLGPFVDRAAKASDSWTGADRTAGTVAREAGSYTVTFDRVRPVEAVTATALPRTTENASVEVRVPGQGWRRIGTLSPTGWTQTAAGGVRADAVRLTWAGQAPAVRHLTPWFADGPQAAFALVRDEADAEIGGGTQRLQARLTAERPADVRGALSAKAPKGIHVAVPQQATVPRGTRTDIPIDVTVDPATPPGEYRVPVSFAGEERTLTVRAYPRTAGPDLARTATASSSGDETPDFPASAASDGDPKTRWSSPAEDGEWWQTDLGKPVRLGQVVLHWQDAYASGYRIQVSADGRTWRTAATVRDGRGARESVRMDAKDTRFVRVQGDRRATRFGYSLWSVEAYAVAG